MKSRSREGRDVPEGEGAHAVEPSTRVRRPGRRLRGWTAGLVVAVLALALVTYQFDLGARWFGFDYPSPVTEPAKVAPPAGLELPQSQPAAPVAVASEDVSVAPANVRRVLRGLVRDRRLGADVAVDVSELADGDVVYRHGTDRVTPASTMKLLTTAAALEALGPDHRFRTRVVTGPGRPGITLVGAGDPLLGRAPTDPDQTYPQRADLATLARSTAKALKDLGRSRVRLHYDASLFTGPTVSPDWEPSYVPDDVVSPISALWVDEGRDQTGMAHRSPDPAAAAAAVFWRQLERRHVRVVGGPTSTVAGADAAELASVQSAPLARIVQHVLEVSDNEGAEVLARHVALATGRPASFAGAAEAVRALLGTLGVDTTGARIVDGSGLSRHDRLRPETLLDVLATAADPDHPELRAALTGLPVAGFTGSLAYRFEARADAALGSVRAKTGTLTGVHGLAGTVTTRDGAVLGFVAVADRVKVPNTLAARDQLDRIAAALAGCTCARTP
jgi:serine-type D-Ala-D-Ala carboxypeptidase/endopeptidase (penicillin-binding protein 4)